MRRTLTALALSTLFAAPAFAHGKHMVKRNTVVAGDQAKETKPAEAKPAEGTAPAEGTKAEKPVKEKKSKKSTKKSETKTEGTGTAPAEAPAK